MATINQLVRKPRARKVAESNVPALEACPRRNVAYVLAYIPPLLRNRTPHCVKFAVCV